MAEVVLAEPLGRGGIAQYTHCLASALLEQGVDVELVTADEYEFADEARYPVTPLFPLRKRAANLPAGPRQLAKMAALMGGIKALSQKAARERPRVIHWQASLVWADWLLARNLARAQSDASHRLIWTAHNILPHEQRRWHRQVYGRIYRQVDQIIIHADDNRQPLAAVEPNHAPASVIPIGQYGFFPTDEVGDRATARRTLGLQETDRVVLFFGVIRAYKGLDILIEACRQIRRQVDGFRLVIAGNPLEPFEPYQRAIEAAGLSDCVLIRTGYIPNTEVAQYFLAADVVALPYRETYQSGVAFTAFSFGVPMVASRVGGISELIERSGGGRLVPAGDTNALARELKELLLNPEITRQLGANGQAYAQEAASWSKIAQRTMAVYGLGAE